MKDMEARTWELFKKGLWEGSWDSLYQVLLEAHREGMEEAAKARSGWFIKSTKVEREFYDRGQDDMAAAIWEKIKESLEFVQEKKQ